MTENYTRWKIIHNSIKTHYSAFTQVSARGTHLILSSQRGALIRGKHSFEGGAH